MAALSRVKPDDPRWAERFELYAGGLELANGYTELTDPAEQRARLVEEQALRARLGRPRLRSTSRSSRRSGGCPTRAASRSGSTACSCCSSGAEAIADVLLFPAEEFLAP